jgi:hypothetical protein
MFQSDFPVVMRQSTPCTSSAWNPTTGSTVALRAQMIKYGQTLKTDGVSSGADRLSERLHTYHRMIKYGAAMMKYVAHVSFSLSPVPASGPGVVNTRWARYTNLAPFSRDAAA